MRKVLLFCGLVIGLMAASMPAQAIKVYFNNPNGWDNVKAYFYKGANEATTWNNAPGMTVSGKLYQIDVPSGFESGQVIFHDGAGQQYPAATGKQLAGSDMILSQDKDNDAKTIWTEYIATPFKVYFDNSTANWTKPTIWYFGASQPTDLTPSQGWPGIEMTDKEGSIYSYTVPAGTAGIIFSNDGSNQTANLVAKPEYKYNQSGAIGENVPVGEDFIVYWDNSGKNWAQPRVHYFGGAEESTWPGVEMTVEAGKVWKATVKAGSTGLVFNDGNGNQVADMTAVAGHVYNASGDQGVYTPAAPEPVVAPDHLYILGTIGETAWTTTPGIELTKSGNTFTATGVVIKPEKAGAANGFFTLVTATGANWDAVNASDRYGAATADAEITPGTAIDVVKYEANVNASGANSWAIPADEYTISVVFANDGIKLTAVKTGEEIVVGNGSLIVPDVTIQPNKDAELEIQIGTDKEMTALQFDIELPSVVSAGTPLISRTMGNHQLSSRVVAENKIRVVVFSEGNQKFSANNGALLYLPLTAAANAATGDYQVQLTGIVFSDKDMQRVTAADVTGKITVEAVATGSITLDKTVVALGQGQTVQLNATVLPEDAAVKTVSWTTDTPSVATVSATGLVTAVANGVATITATCNGLTATCKVYVGKLANEITWTQTLANLGAGKSVDLEATALGGDVTFVITSGAGLATLTGNKLTAGDRVGVVTVEARCEGNEQYAPAEPISRNITIWLGYIEGDVNGDETVDLDDATTVVSKILGNTPDPFNEAAADLNGDGNIDVVDVTLIIDKVLKAARPNAAQQRISPYAGNPEGYEQFAITGNKYTLQVSFSNMEDYVATRFDIALPEGVNVTDASVAGSSHSASFRYLGNNITRVVVLSMNNDEFASDGYISLTLSKAATGDITLDNAFVNRTDGANIIQTPALGFSTTPSGIETVNAEALGTPVFYNLQGVRVDNPAAGSIVIRVLGNKAEKVLVK